MTRDHQNESVVALSAPERALIDAYWRAANYLSVGQIYLYDNPLLKQPLTKDHIKPRLLGHWGTTPGLNFIYVHLNRVIKKHDLDMIYIAGPGHGGPGLVANTYLEGPMQSRQYATSFSIISSSFAATATTCPRSRPGVGDKKSDFEKVNVNVFAIRHGEQAGPSWQATGMTDIHLTEHGRLFAQRMWPVLVRDLLWGPSLGVRERTSGAVFQFTLPPAESSSALNVRF